jgi:hypothetical protein
VTNFICEVCESTENPQSEQWEEMCIYCNENALIANLEMLEIQIREHQKGMVLLDRCAICDNENDLCAGHIGGELN